MIVDSGNHYLGALKGNQGRLLQDVKTHFVAQQCSTLLRDTDIGGLKKRIVVIDQDGMRPSTTEA
ncbi:MAG: hypothetical protein AAGL17_00870 [Cyanobacteria bacterium J06576_12]